MNILVVGGSGGVGGELVRQLVAAGHGVRVTSRAPKGSEVRADIGDPASMRAAGEGMTSAFLYVPMQGDVGAAALALREAGVERITVLSTIDAANDSVAARFNRDRHLEAENGVAASGAAFTCLRPGAFASNAQRFFLPQLTTGSDVVRLPFPTSQQAPIAAADIAAVAARALTTSDLDGLRPVLTGPRSLTQYEQVETLARVLGRPLRVERVSTDDARRTMLERIPPRYVEMLLGQWEEETHQPATVTPEVERLTGRAPIPYEAALTDLCKA